MRYRSSKGDLLFMIIGSFLNLRTSSLEFIHLIKIFRQKD